LYDLKKELIFVIAASFMLIMADSTGNFTEAKTLKDNKVLPNSTGRPLPRFVSLRATVVNLRTGPGVRYPVDWVYESKYLPIEVIAEFENWRKVRDVQGTQGWIHQSMLSSRRMFIIISKMQTLRKKDETKSLAIAKLATNVIGELKRCPVSSGWCEVSAGGHKGWLRRVDFWGVYAQETIK
jgi:SH3-like domain-containing protein